jgi:hypothetical protein
MNLSNTLLVTRASFKDLVDHNFTRAKMARIYFKGEASVVSLFSLPPPPPPPPSSSSLPLSFKKHRR